MQRLRHGALCRLALRMRRPVNSGRLTRMRKTQEQQADAGRTPQPRAAAGELVGDSARQPERANTMIKPREIGGPKGAEPTRFGDWERARPVYRLLAMANPFAAAPASP